MSSPVTRFVCQRCPFFPKIFQRHELTLQLIFFDGEEAIKKWEGDDNTYGSRDLARKWHNLPYSL